MAFGEPQPGAGGPPPPQGEAQPFNLDQAIVFTNKTYEAMQRTPQGEHLEDRMHFWFGFHSQIDDRVIAGEYTREQGNMLRARADALRDINQIFDPLTNTFTKAAISEFLKRELQSAKATGRTLTVVMTDLKEFKLFNDTYGHLIGDEVLQAFARHLGTNLQTPFFGRYGGDEFLTFYDGKTVAEVEEIFRITEGLMDQAMQPIRERRGIARPIRMDHGFIETTPKDTYETVITKAEALMYGKKREDQRGADNG